MARFPVKTSMPGLQRVVIQNGAFLDRGGIPRRIAFEFFDGPPLLTVRVDDGSMCSFVPWPGYSTFWQSTGVVVQTHRVGIASAIYTCAAAVLAQRGEEIAPSDNLTNDGRDLWKMLDPNIKTETVAATGGHRPDLTGQSPP